MSPSKIDHLKRDLDQLTAPRGQKADTPADDRGRDAEHPGRIPSTGWLDVLWRVWGEISEANIFLISGGVTYAILLALFPGLAAAVSVYGLFLDSSKVEQQVGALTGVLPEQSRQLLADELHKLASAPSATLRWSAIVGLLLALWSASRGMSGFISALNIAYEERETRSFIRLNLLAVSLTVGMIIGGLFVISLIAVLPAAVEFIGLGGTTKWVLLIVQWPLLLLVVLLALAVLYRYAPDRTKAQWRWVSPGAFAATIFWLIGSIGFSVYVANFNSYDKTYGSLGGVVILLTWLYLSSLVVLLGAAINAQSEKQTRIDSTEDPPKPMGQRGAVVADTLGEIRE
jgi:membrane protein